MEKRQKILNGTFEVALRLLAILSTCRISMTVERIAIYSYFCIYLTDYDENEKSLHPKIPFRNASFINSKEVIHNAIELLLSKGLIETDLSETLFKISASELGSALYAQIDGTYKDRLVNNIIRAHSLFGKKTDKMLYDFVYNNMSKWGSEFSYESVIKEIGYAE